jgi:hypothetical protein
MNTAEYEIWDSVTPKAITSSTDATPIVMTVSTHGYSTGDVAMIQGHTTNIAANGLCRVTKVTADTFSIQDAYSGADIAGTGAGAGASGVVTPVKVMYAGDWNNIEFSIDTASSANLTLKFAISDGLLAADQTIHGDTPRFGATQSHAAPYMFCDFGRLDNAGTITDGDTGVALTGTDVHTKLELNQNGCKYVCPIITAYSAGVVSLKCRMSQS